MDEATPDWPTRFIVSRVEYERLVKVEAAARAYLDAESEPPLSWVIESQAARHEGRPNREVERMERIAQARAVLLVALRAAPEDETNG